MQASFCCSVDRETNMKNYVTHVSSFCTGLGGESWGKWSLQYLVPRC